MYTQLHNAPLDTVCSSSLDDLWVVQSDHINDQALAALAVSEMICVFNMCLICFLYLFNMCLMCV